MRKLNFIIYALFYWSATFAQEKMISGIVKFNGETIADVEVINWKKKKVTKSDKNGMFSISISLKEELIFYSKKYITKKILINKERYSLDEIVVDLEKKQIELDEVEIKRSPNLKIDMSYESLNTVKIQKEASKLKVEGVYLGGIPNGMDFIEIGKKIHRLFFKKKDIKNNENKGIQLKNYISKNFTDEFLIKNLNLRAEEIPFFVDFCVLEINSSEDNFNNGILDVMEFLIEKRKKYKN